MIDALGGPLMVVIGALFLFAGLGLVSACVYQWREYRKRRMMRGVR